MRAIQRSTTCQRTDKTEYSMIHLCHTPYQQGRKTKSQRMGRTAVLEYPLDMIRPLYLWILNSWCCLRKTCTRLSQYVPTPMDGFQLEPLILHDKLYCHRIISLDPEMDFRAFTIPSYEPKANLCMTVKIKEVIPWLRFSLSCTWSQDGLIHWGRVGCKRSNVCLLRTYAMLSVFRLCLVCSVFQVSG